MLTDVKPTQGGYKRLEIVAAKLKGDRAILSRMITEQQVHFSIKNLLPPFDCHGVPHDSLIFFLDDAFYVRLEISDILNGM